MSTQSLTLEGAQVDLFHELLLLSAHPLSFDEEDARSLNEGTEVTLRENLRGHIATNLLTMFKGNFDEAEIEDRISTKLTHLKYLKMMFVLVKRLKTSLDDYLRIEVMKLESANRRSGTNHEKRKRETDEELDNDLAELDILRKRVRLQEH